MESKVSGPWTFTALQPPPPPLPLSFKFPKNKEADDCKAVPKPAFSELSFKDEQIELLKFMFPFQDIKIISYCKPIIPVRQNGPTCGLVALSMASQYFRNIESQDLLNTAKDMNFTKLGEMFSVYNMAKLASCTSNCDVDVVKDLRSNKDNILKHICSGWPVLIPYDKDKNNTPCLHNGESAHWAVINGIAIALPEDLVSDLEFATFSHGVNVHIADSGTNLQELLNHAVSICFYAYQGKSKRLQLWDFDVLIESNRNLHEATKKYAPGEMNIPENGILSELRDKAILLKPKT